MNMFLVGRNGELPLFDVFGDKRTPSHSIRGIGDGWLVAIPPMCSRERAEAAIDAIKSELEKTQAEQSAPKATKEAPADDSKSDERPPKKR